MGPGVDKVGWKVCRTATTPGRGYRREVGAGPTRVRFVRAVHSPGGRCEADTSTVAAGVSGECICYVVRQPTTQPYPPVYLSGTPPWRVVYSGRHRCSEPDEEPLATVVPEDQGEGVEEEEAPGVLVAPGPGASAVPPQQHRAVMRPDCAA